MQFDSNHKGPQPGEKPDSRLCGTDKHKLLSDSRYGFRLTHSTAQALTGSVEQVINATEQKRHAAGVFLNLKIFDTIDYEILINKLERYLI